MRTGKARRERELIERIQRNKNDNRASRALYQLHQHLVQAVCRRMLWGPDSEDAVQETFFKAFQQIGSHQSHRSFQRWLVQIATNVCIDQHRYAARRPALCGFERPAAGTTDSTPECELAKLKLREAYLEVFASLTPRQRVYAGLLAQGVAKKEIAERVGVSRTRVWIVVRQIREKFRRACADRGVFDYLPAPSCS